MKNYTQDDLFEILEILNDINKVNKLDSLSSSCDDMADALHVCKHFLLEQQFKDMSKKFNKIKDDLEQICTYAQKFVDDEGAIDDKKALIMSALKKII